MGCSRCHAGCASSLFRRRRPRRPRKGLRRRTASVMGTPAFTWYIDRWCRRCRCTSPAPAPTDRRCPRYGPPPAWLATSIRIWVRSRSAGHFSPVTPVDRFRSCANVLKMLAHGNGDGNGAGHDAGACQARQVARCHRVRAVDCQAGAPGGSQDVGAGAAPGEVVRRGRSTGRARVESSPPESQEVTLPRPVVASLSRRRVGAVAWMLRDFAAAMFGAPTQGRWGQRGCGHAAGRRRVEAGWRRVSPGRVERDGAVEARPAKDAETGRCSVRSRSWAALRVHR